jgi:RNA 3'-terminal phosphate cyclase (ATP)
LLRQHLTAVQAAAAVGAGETDGPVLGSKSLTFVPGKIQAGEYNFAIGTAGSGTLVLQTILPVLMTASGPSRVVIEGGTHNKGALPLVLFFMTILILVIGGWVASNQLTRVTIYEFQRGLRYRKGRYVRR